MTKLKRKTLKKVSKQLAKASKLHAGQSKKISNLANMMKDGGYMDRMAKYQAGGLNQTPMYGANTMPGTPETAQLTYQEADQAKLDALNEQLKEQQESTAFMDEAKANTDAQAAKISSVEQGLGQGVKGLDKVGVFDKLKEKGATKAADKLKQEALAKGTTLAAGVSDDALKAIAPKLFEKSITPGLQSATSSLPSSLANFSVPSLTTTPLSQLGTTASTSLVNPALGQQGANLLNTGANVGASAGKGLIGGVGVGGVGAIASLAGEGIKMASDDQDATTMNTGETIGSGLSGIGTGIGAAMTTAALMGSTLGPIGTAAGVIGGAAYGLGKGLIQRGKARREEGKAEKKQEVALNKIKTKQKIEGLKDREYSGYDMGQNLARYGGIAKTNMRLGGGSRLMKYRDGGFKLGPEVFRNGGVKLPGGMMEPIPGSAAVEFKGKSHEEGGIMLDPMTEVEGGETMGPVTMKHGGKNDYFFSEHLKLGGKSFAQRHKELLKYGGTQKHIDELAAMQEKVAGRDPKQIAANGGPRMYETGGPRPDVIKKMDEKGFIWDANANDGRGAFIRGTDVTRQNRTDKNNMTARNTFLSDADTNAAVEKLADNLGVSVDEVLDILEAESMYKSDAVNPTSGATGLIQFMPDSREVNYKTIGGKQYTMSEIAQMSPVQQLELAEKYFKGVGYKPNSGKPLYLAVAYPESLNTKANDILISADTEDPKQQAILKQNPNWLDANGNMTGASIASYGAPDSNYGAAEIKSTPPKGSIDIGDRVLLDDEAEYYKSLSPEQKEEYKTFKRDNRNNPNELFMGDEDVVGNVDFDDDDLAANYSNRKDLVNARMGDIEKPNKPRKNDYYSKSRYAKDGSRLKPGKTRDVFEEELYKNAMSEYSSSLDVYKNSKSAANEFADSKGYRSNLQKVGDFTRKNDIGTMAATGLQFIPAAMAYKDKPDYMANPTDIRNVDLERVSYNTERASNAADSNAMSKFIETSGMGPAGIIAKMASYRQKQEGDMKIASDETRANTAIANQEAMINRQIDSDNTKNDMVVDEFNRAADASTKDRKLEAVNNAVQTIAGINRDRLMRRANDRMALAVEGTTGVLDRFDLRLQASQIAGASSGDEYNNVLQQLQLQQQVQMQNNPLLQRLGGKRYGK